MKKWTIGKRITIGFVVLVIITIMVGIAGYVGLNAVKRLSNSLVTDSMPSALVLGQVKENLSRGYSNIERIIRTPTGAVRDDAEKTYNALTEANSQLYKEYETYLYTDDDKAQYQSLLSVRKEYAESLTKLFALEKGGDTNATYAYLDGTFVAQYRNYRDAIDQILNGDRKESMSIGKDIQEEADFCTVFIIVSILIALALAVTIAIIIIRGTNKVLEKAITSIDEGSSQVAAAASQVSAASNMLAEGASEQAASLEETSSSLEEMSSMTSQNAKNAQEAKNVADDMHASADSSAEQMKEMQKAMDAIKESSAGIAQIIKTIDEIAFQTNILALNAAVEAARAGEAGAGFAVVAEEVRNLAQRSAQSAKETSAKIEGAIRNSDHGVMLSAKVAESLNSIVGKARTMNGLVSEIATASSEQDKGIGQLTVAVQQMDKVTQANASNAEETASASEELNAHADSLKETVVELVALVRSDARENSGSSSSSFRAAAPSHTSVAVRQKSASRTPTKVLTKASSSKTPSSGHFLPQSDSSSKPDTTA